MPALSKLPKFSVPEREAKAGQAAIPEPISRPSLVAQRRMGFMQSPLVDFAFKGLVVTCAVSILVIVGLIVMQLVLRSRLSIVRFGFGFFTGTAWDPVAENFGALPFVYGTLVSSLVALAIAVPLSVGTAVFLAEVCPRWLRGALSFAVELLA
ncbi:MAG TPA: phosphate ABC transporter permease subunit PstC, partial [Alphaproteobacteria bacterium]|nr:phosphate ABC transporter permease subunit PstC [Alphaproteobacteria bacterium]